MAFWLLKTEPTTYSWDDLVRQKRAVWDGVANAVALKNLRAMKAGDLALIYHTGQQRCAVGVARIARAAYPDPHENDARLLVIDIQPDHKLPHPVTLAQIRADPAFQGWDLLRIGRLSVVPVPPSMWRRIDQLARTP